MVRKRKRKRSKVLLLLVGAVFIYFILKIVFSILPVEVLQAKTSELEDTFAGETYEDNIPDEIKQQRASGIMAIQQEISAEINAQKIGLTMKVIIDRKEGEYFIGRTEFDSPEVDGEVLIKAEKLETGHFYNVKIISADDFDLYGEIE